MVEDRQTDPADADGWPAVSVVMPVLNEARHLAEATRRILDQDYPGELEIIVAVAPSKDRTAQVAGDLAAADPRVRTVANPSGRTPAGLNAAVAASRFPIVVRVDGHGLLPPTYIATAVDLLRQTGASNVGGVMAAEGQTAFEQAVARAMTSWFGVGGARFHTGGEPGPAETVYLGVFRREVLENLGGYDERFIRAQDWELNHRIRAGGGLVWFSPTLSVTYRPRSTLTALARQYFDYGRWRRVVMRQHAGTTSLRYLAPPLAVLGCALGLLVAPFWWPALALPVGYLLSVLAGCVATASGLSWRSKAALPGVYLTMHLCWGLGFLSSPSALLDRVAQRQAAARAAGSGSSQDRAAGQAST